LVIAPFVAIIAWWNCGYRTCASAWDGYDMDYSDAICGLLSADELQVV